MYLPSLPLPFCPQSEQSEMEVVLEGATDCQCDTFV